MGYKTIEPQLGDIIIDTGTSQESEPCHSMMWVGGDKPIAHATDGKASMVVRHRLVYLMGNNKGSHLADQYAMYRHNDHKIGPLAAKFAITWASTGIEDKRPTAQVPYGMQRRSNARTLSNELNEKNVVERWDTMSLFHAVRAYARMKNELPLAGHWGVSCSQFVTYCYQCASIEGKLGTNSPDPSILKSLIRSDNSVALKTDMNVVAIKRNVIREFSEQKNKVEKTGGMKIPQLVSATELMKESFFGKAGIEELELKLAMAKALQVDAKYAYVETLYKQLEEEGSGFTKIGYGIVNSDEKPEILRILPVPEFLQMKRDPTYESRAKNRKNLTANAVRIGLEGF